MLQFVLSIQIMGWSVISVKKTSSLQWVKLLNSIDSKLGWFLIKLFSWLRISLKVLLSNVKFIDLNI